MRWVATRKHFASGTASIVFRIEWKILSQFNARIACENTSNPVGPKRKPFFLHFRVSGLGVCYSRMYTLLAGIAGPLEVDVYRTGRGWSWHVFPLRSKTINVRLLERLSEILLERLLKILLERLLERLLKRLLERSFEWLLEILLKRLFEWLFEWFFEWLLEWLFQ